MFVYLSASFHSVDNNVSVFCFSGFCSVMLDCRGFIRIPLKPVTPRTPKHNIPFHRINKCASRLCPFLGTHTRARRLSLCVIVLSKGLTVHWHAETMNVVTRLSPQGLTLRGGCVPLLHGKSGEGRTAASVAEASPSSVLGNPSLTSCASASVADHVKAAMSAQDRTMVMLGGEAAVSAAAAAAASAVVGGAYSNCCGECTGMGDVGYACGRGVCDGGNGGLVMRFCARRSEGIFSACSQPRML